MVAVQAVRPAQTHKRIEVAATHQPARGAGGARGQSNVLAAAVQGELAIDCEEVVAGERHAHLVARRRHKVVAVEEHAELVGIGLAVCAQFHEVGHRTAHHLQALALAVTRNLQQGVAVVVPEKALGRGPGATQAVGRDQAEQLAQLRSKGLVIGKGWNLHIQGTGHVQITRHFQAVEAVATQQSQSQGLVGCHRLVPDNAQHPCSRTCAAAVCASHSVAIRVRQAQTLSGSDFDLALGHQLRGVRDAYLFRGLQPQLTTIGDHVAPQRQEAFATQGLQHDAAAAQGTYTG